MRPRILVVEDDHALRDVLLRGLRDEDFDAVPAQDGATALRLVRDDFAGVVLDVGLPDADGRDVCQAMRANGLRFPIVFLTAHHRLTDRLSGFSAGGDDYLPKPFHLAELGTDASTTRSRSSRHFERAREWGAVDDTERLHRAEAMAPASIASYQADRSSGSRSSWTRQGPGGSWLSDRWAGRAP
jgi:DNA-binding response OmpR family regulator